MNGQDLNDYGSEDRFNAGVAGDQESSGSAARVHTGMPRANLLIAGVCLAGIGCVYLLSLYARPQTASADQNLTDLQVDSALSGMARINAAHGKALEVVNTFYYQARQRQIPLKDLKNNPFIFKSPASPKLISQPLPKEPPAPVKKLDRKPAQETAELKKLVLQSVLIGSREPVAMISNNLLTEGQKISGWTLIRIEPRRVTLRRQEKTYVLRMSQ